MVLKCNSLPSTCLPWSPSHAVALHPPPTTASADSLHDGVKRLWFGVVFLFFFRRWYRLFVAMFEVPLILKWGCLERRKCRLLKSSTHIIRRGLCHAFERRVHFKIWASFKKRKPLKSMGVFSFAFLFFWYVSLLAHPCLNRSTHWTWITQPNEMTVYHVEA